MKIYILIVVLLLVGFTTEAQQDPLYAQYMNNLLAINPAYAGSHTLSYSTLQYRSQWTGLAGHPVTVNFSTHMPVVANKVGLGIQIIQDRIGENKNTEFNTSYSYRIDVGEANLFFGLQAGVMNFSNDPGDLNILDPDDPYYNRFSELKFNTGVGLMLVDNDRYVVGVSAPRLLPSTINSGGKEITVYQQNYYVFGSYLFLLSDKVRFKPAVLLKATKSVAASVDINANFTFIDRYSAGLFTRNFNSYGLLLSMRFEKYQLGYVVEVPGSRSSSLPFVSHEILLGIRLKALTFHDTITVQNF